MSIDDVRVAIKELNWWDEMSHEDNRPGCLDHAMKVARFAAAVLDPPANVKAAIKHRSSPASGKSVIDVANAVIADWIVSLTTETTK